MAWAQRDPSIRTSAVTRVEPGKRGKQGNRSKVAYFLKPELPEQSASLSQLNTIMLCEPVLGPPFGDPRLAATSAIGMEQVAV